MSGTALASSISARVRWRTNTGKPRHMMVTDCAFGDGPEHRIRSLASASTDASGLSWLISGQTTPATPTAHDGARGDIEKIAPARIWAVS